MSAITHSEQPPQQSFCEPVAEMLTTLDGRVPKPGPRINHPSRAKEVEDTIVQIEAANEGAEKGMTSLGCAACQLATLCPVKKGLEQKAEADNNQRTLAETTRMIKEAPDWLNAARFNLWGAVQRRMNRDPKLRFTQIGNDASVASEAIQTGEVASFLCGITNKSLPPVSKKDIPELSGIERIPANAELPVTAITMADGERFTVVDASGVMRLEGQIYPKDEDFGRLTAKLVERMAQSSSRQNGQKQIQEADGHAQKILVRASNANPLATVFEIRVGDRKARLYCSVYKPIDGANDEPVRIVLYGVQGHDPKAQTKNVDNYLVYATGYYNPNAGQAFRKRG